MWISELPGKVGRYWGARIEDNNFRHSAAVSRNERPARRSRYAAAIVYNLARAEAEKRICFATARNNIQ